MVTNGRAPGGSVPAQLLGLAMLIVGGVWAWGPAFLLVAGALLLAGPELVRFAPAAPAAAARVVVWARVDVPRAVQVARGEPR